MRRVRPVRTLALSSAAGLWSTLPAWAEESDKGGLPQLNTALFPEQLFWLAVSFAVLYVLMSMVALPRVAKTQDNRKLIIASEIETARVASEKARATIAAIDKSLSDARLKAQSSVADMISDVAHQASVKQGLQHAELLRTLRRAEEDIAVTREAALKSIKASASDLAAVAVEKVLGFKPKGGA